MIEARALVQELNQLNLSEAPFFKNVTGSFQVRHEVDRLGHLWVFNASVVSGGRDDVFAAGIIDSLFTPETGLVFVGKQPYFTIVSENGNRTVGYKWFNLPNGIDEQVFVTDMKRFLRAETLMAIKPPKFGQEERTFDGANLAYERFFGVLK